MVNKTLSRRIFTEILHPGFMDKHLYDVIDTLLNSINTAESTHNLNTNWSYKRPNFKSNNNFYEIYSHKFMTDSVFFIQLGILYDIKMNGGNNYYFEEAFLNSLSTANDNVPLTNLPEFWTGFIITPKEYFLDEEDGDSYDGVLISIYPDKDDNTIKDLYFSFVKDHDKSGGKGSIYSGKIKISTEKTVIENEIFSRENSKVYPGGHLINVENKALISKKVMVGSGMVYKYFKTILNIIFYLHCSGIEVDYVPSKRNAKSKEIKEFEKNGVNGKLWNKTLLPVVHVYPTFEKFQDEMMNQEREFYVEQTFVKGHMRFYRMGKGRKDVVYKWRVGHIRHFKTGTSELSL